MHQRGELGIVCIILVIVQLVCTPGILGNEPADKLTGLGLFCAGFTCAIFAFFGFGLDNYRIESPKWFSLLWLVIWPIIMAAKVGVK